MTENKQTKVAPEIRKKLKELDPLAKYSGASFLSKQINEARLCYYSKNRFDEHYLDFLEDYSDLLEGKWSENCEIFISRFCNDLSRETAMLHREFIDNGIPKLPKYDPDRKPLEVLNELQRWLESVDDIPQKG